MSPSAVRLCAVIAAVYGCVLSVSGSQPPLTDGWRQQGRTSGNSGSFPQGVAIGRSVSAVSLGPANAIAVAGSPVVSTLHNAVYVVTKGSPKGTIAAIPLLPHHKCESSTTVRWTQYISGTPVASPALSDDQHTLYVGSKTGVILALNAATGTLLWSLGLENSAPVSSSLRVDGELLVFSSMQGADWGMYVVNTTAQAVSTRCRTPGRLTRGPVVAAGMVYMVDDNRNVYAVAASGSDCAGNNPQAQCDFCATWRTDTALDALPAAEPAFDAASSTLLIPGLPVRSNQPPQLFSLTTSAPNPGNTSQTVAPLTSTSPLTSSAAIVTTNGKTLAFVGDAAGFVHAVDVTHKTVLWSASVEPRGQVSASPVSDGTMVIAAGTAGSVVALDATTGKQRWAYQYPGVKVKISAPVAIDGNGVVYSGNDAGKFVGLAVCESRQWVLYAAIGGGVGGFVLLVIVVVCWRRRRAKGLDDVPTDYAHMDNDTSTVHNTTYGSHTST